ncbi:hypothetical protein MNBD_GAMMA17-2065 [hydrothermal vent metagenome]|uniref:Bacterial transcriptional activator domain-containing protein n=1 Tax=hydrothermal vent metagenome TaxID=652676 RepID=A0A3B0ZR09_9ZZZZ
MVKKRMLSGSRKTCRPLVHKVLTRSRLFEVLDDASDFPATAVLASAGYGKTTLASSYVESKQVLSIWYCVDGGDTDLASFFVNFTLAVQQATPERGNVIPLYQAENALNIKAFARRYFEAVYQRLGQSFYLVFDDIHECPSQQWADVIAMAVEGVPFNGRIFIMGRHALPAEFSRLHLNQLIYTLREKDLYFNNDELTQLAPMHNIDTLTQAQCDKLQDMMAGWVAGLTLMLARSDKIDNSSMQAFDAREDLLNYFKNEVLRHIDEQTRAILYRTCYLPDLSIESATTLTQNLQVASILKNLHDQRYFIYRITDAEVIYRYHPLFRTLLMAQSKEVLSEQSLQQVLDTSIDLLEKSGDLEAAVTLLIKIDNMARLAQFIIMRAKELLTGNRMQTLMKCLQHIPAQTIEASGWLLYWRGMCTVPMRPRMARQDFSAAFDFFSSNSDVTGQCLSIVGIIDSYLFERDEFVSLDPWITQVDQLRTVFDQKATTPALHVLTLKMFSALLHRAPGHQDFDLWLGRIEKISMTELPPGLRITRQISLILHGIWHGDFQRATMHHSVLEKQLKNSPEHVPTILWYTIHCCFLWATGEAQQSLTVAKEGLARVKEYNLPLLNIGLLTHGAAAALMAHNNAEAKKLLEAATPVTNEAGHTHLVLYHILYTVYSCRNNDNEAVHYHGKEALNSAIASGLPFFQSSAHLACAQIYMLDGNIEKTVHHVNASEAIVTKMNSHFHQFSHLLLAAIFDWSLGQQDTALGLLKDALVLARQYHLLPGLWVCEDELAQILAQALRHDIETTVAQKIIRQRQLMPEYPPYDIKEWPWPVCIYTLGRFEIHIDGKRLESPARSRPKLFALLKTLIAFGGTLVREERISEAVWPDADGDAAHQLFDTTLFRLRKVLGLHQALINRDGRLSLNKKLCWLDVWALNAEVDALGDAIKADYPADDLIMKYEENLCRIYRGDFLPADESLPVFIPPRQKIHLSLIRALYLILDYWFHHNRTKELELSLKRVNERFPAEEKPYLMLMGLYRSQKRFSEAVNTYRLCEQVMQRDYNMVPSYEMKSEYNLACNHH